MLISVLTLVATPPPASIHSKEDLLAAKQELITAYENDDYDAFVEAFPSSFVDFARLFGCFPNIDYNLANQKEDYCKYFVLGGEKSDPKLLDKLVSISKGFLFVLGGAPGVLKTFVREVLDRYPQECATFFENKDDEEIFSFFRMTFQSEIPCLEDQEILEIQQNLSKYSDKLGPIMEKAYIQALIDSADIELEIADNPYKISWW